MLSLKMPGQIMHPSNGALAAQHNKEFYLVFYIKNEDFLTSGPLGTKNPNHMDSFLCMNTKTLKKISIFVQHKKVIMIIKYAWDGLKKENRSNWNQESFF